MKIILLSKPVPYRDFCDDHQQVTMHYCLFNKYLPKTHEVQFWIYCGACYDKLGEECPCWEITKPVSFWIKLLEESDNVNEN